MMLSVMVVGAGAAFSDQSKIKNTEAVDMCVALNIISGYPDGSYKPEGNITRAEFAKMICVLLNGGTTPATATNTTPTFNDVRGNANAAWAEGFIEYCYAKGIVSGVGGGKFAPNGNVTATEAAKMLLVALGYNATVENYTGASWALKVNVQANQDGLYKGLETIDTGAALTRDNAAQMVWNALQAYVIDKSSSIDRTDGSVTDIYTKNTTVDLIAKMYDGIIAKGELSAFEYNSKDAKWTYTVKLTEPRTIRENNGELTTVYYVDVVSKTDYTALLGQKVKAVYKYDKNAKENTVYGIFSVDSNVVLTGLIGDLPKMTKSDDTSFKMNGQTYKLQSGLTLATVPVYQFTTSAETALFKVDTEKKDSDNNTIYRGSALWDVAGQYAKADTSINVKAGDNITKYDAQKFTAVDKDGNGKIDFFMVVPFSVKKVTYVSSTQFALAGGSKTDLDDVTAYKGMARDDYVIYTAKENTANDTATLVKADLVSGKITSTDSPNAKIGDNWYTFDFSYGSNITTNCKPGNELKDAVVVNGYIFDVDKVNKTAITDFAVVVATEAGGVNGNQAKLLFSDGKKEVVSTDKNYKNGTVKVGDENVSIAIEDGTLVTYSKNADGDYILTAVEAGKNGYDLDSKYFNVKKVSNSSDKVGYINGKVKVNNADTEVAATVNDDAVIFVQYKGDSYKVITGAQLKKIATSDVSVDTTNGKGLVVGSKDGNTYNVEMAYISLGAKDVNDADTYYGYITGVTSTKNDDQQTVDVVKVWTNEGEKTYEFANTSVTYKYPTDPTDKDAAKKLLKAGSVIEFKLNDKDKINEVVSIYDVDAVATTATNGSYSAATVAISALTPTFQFEVNKVLQTQTNNKYFELDKDTVYLYIENSDQIGVDAKDQSLNTASKNQDGSLMLNAFVLYDNTDGSVKLVVYDVDGDIAE